MLLSYIDKRYGDKWDIKTFMVKLTKNVGMSKAVDYSYFIVVYIRVIIAEVYDPILIT